MTLTFGDIVAMLGGDAIFGIAIAYLFRSWLQQRASEELARLNAKLAEETAQAVAEKVEPLKAALQVDLEERKSVLTLGSEVRKIVAARKVEMLMELVSNAHDVWLVLKESGHSDTTTSISAAVDALNHTGQRIRIASALLTPVQASKLWGYYSELQNGWTSLGQARTNHGEGWEPAAKRLGAASDKLLEFVREELLVVAAPLVENP